jgi:alpha-mannosidase
VLENEWLRVEADPQDGTLRVTDKATWRTLSGLNRVQDGGDRGDEYNYCPPAQDTLVTRPVEPPTITCRDEGPFGQVMAITARYALPAALADDRDARAPETVELPVTTTVRLVPGVRRVDVHTALDNRAQDHRLRVLFPAGVAADRAIVDGHFDRLERGPVAVTDTQGWAEQPTPTAAQRVFSAVERDGVGLMVAARGLPEYEHITGANGSTLALTLLRSVGWLSRDDLACRPRHAGPGRPTPGAQCTGPASYDYSLIPFGGESFGLDEAAHAAFAFAAPLRAAASEAAQGPLPPELRFVALEPAAWVLTALKPAESGEGIVVRFYNSSAAAVSGRVEFGLPVDEVTPVNLLEEPVDLPGMRAEGCAVWLDVPGKRIVTLRVVFAAR